MEHEILRKILADRAKTTPETEADSPEQAQPFDLRTASPLDLQRMIGNKATSALLKSGSSVIQTKMTVTAANDAHEQEADKVAEQVVSRGQQAQNLQRDGEDVALARIQREGEEEEVDNVDMKRLQRQGDFDDDDDDDSDSDSADADMDMDMDSDSESEADMDMDSDSDSADADMGYDADVDDDDDDNIDMKRIQRQENVDMMGAFDVGGEVEEQINNTSGGQKLDDGVRGQMESGIGADFSNVNVHTDSNADALNRSLQARAFTHGNDVFFRSGEYNPGSSDGQKLLAHELTHVVQQGGAQAKREDADK